MYKKINNQIYNGNRIDEVKELARLNRIKTMIQAQIDDLTTAINSP